MFQYAIGRAIAIRNEAHLQLDTRHYSKTSAFAYGLNKFRIQATPAPSDTLPPTKSNLLKYAAWRYVLQRTHFIKEKTLNYDHRVEKINRSIYLHGYWQSERYFREVSQSIRSDFALKNAPTSTAQAIEHEIQSSPSIAVHVRRGDYITNRKANAFHGTCSLAYYRTAVENILSQTSAEMTAYVFSDDPTWASENLRLPCRTKILDQDTGSPQEDLHLMATCTHQVISNSTFSWWAAWLNPNPTKIVVAPTPWFSGKTDAGKDIVPAKWIRLSSSGIDENKKATIGKVA